MITYDPFPWFTIPADAVPEETNGTFSHETLAILINSVLKDFSSDIVFKETSHNILDMILKKNNLKYGCAFSLLEYNSFYPGYAKIALNKLLAHIEEMFDSRGKLPQL